MNFFNKLDHRERLLVISFLVVLVVTSFIMGLSFLYNLSNDIRQEADRNKEIFQSLNKIKNVISGKKIKKAPEKSQVFAEVNNLLNKYKLKPLSINEEKKTGKDFRIFVRLQSIPLTNFIYLLHEIEYKNRFPLFISDLMLRKNTSNKEAYDISFKIGLN